MFRDKMKIFTTAVFALSLLMGELSLSVPGVAYASNQATTPVTSVPQTTTRWVRCNVDGDADADDWCWVGSPKVVIPDGTIITRNGITYVVRNGRLFIKNVRLFRRNRFLPGNGYFFSNGYIMRNGQIVGYMNNFGNPIYYYP
jgi:hypothetical protein